MTIDITKILEDAILRTEGYLRDLSSRVSDLKKEEDRVTNELASLYKQAARFRAFEECTCYDCNEYNKYNA